MEKYYELLSQDLDIDYHTVVPRYQKEKCVQQSRTKEKAEVFTPLPIIKKMNDDVDKDFTGTDEEYIDRKVIEVTCGEAPFLTTRYDAQTGRSIPLNDRQGLLDRKLMRIKGDYQKMAERALKSTYGYEFQKDSLFLARKNIFLSVVEYSNEELSDEALTEFCHIISLNIFRMDGTTLCIPNTDKPAKIMNWDKNIMERFDEKPEQITLW